MVWMSSCCVLCRCVLFYVYMLIVVWRELCAGELEDGDGVDEQLLRAVQVRLCVEDVYDDACTAEWVA